MSDTCPICIQEFEINEQGIYKTACGHRFHVGCFGQYRI